MNFSQGIIYYQTTYETYHVLLIGYGITLLLLCKGSHTVTKIVV